MSRKKKSKPVKFRFRWRSECDTRWIPTCWETNSKRDAMRQAQKYRNDPTAQVYDYENKCPL